MEDQARITFGVGFDLEMADCRGGRFIKVLTYTRLQCYRCALGQRLLMRVEASKKGK